MNANQNYLKKSLMVLGILLLIGAIIGMASGAWVQSVQAAPKRTRTPRPTPSPIYTPTQTPFTATPTPADPTCWSVVPAPDVPGYGARLLAIAGSSDNDLWAVGWFLENNSRHNLTLHWNGSAWERVPVPDVVNVGDNSVNGLYGVAAIAPNDVWAVGYAVSLSTPYQTVTLHWNGSAWQLFSEPPEVINWYTTSRFGVTARASNDVWAVGQFSAWHWDGSTWSVPGGFSGQNLLGTSASGGALWSAGTNPGYYTSEGGYIPASPNALFFDGTTWQTTSPVRDPSIDTGFNSIKVLSPSNVWAVGFAGKFVLTERWDGSQWTRVEAANGNPNPPADQAFGNRLYAVNGTSTGLWAVGSFDDAGGVERILIERYTCK